MSFSASDGSVAAPSEASASVATSATSRPATASPARRRATVRRRSSLNSPLVRRIQPRHVEAAADVFRRRRTRNPSDARPAHRRRRRPDSGAHRTSCAIGELPYSSTTTFTLPPNSFATSRTSKLAGSERFHVNGQRTSVIVTTALAFAVAVGSAGASARDRQGRHLRSPPTRRGEGRRCRSRDPLRRTGGTARRCCDPRPAGSVARAASMRSRVASACRRSAQRREEIARQQIFEQRAFDRAVIVERSRLLQRRARADVGRMAAPAPSFRTSSSSRRSNAASFDASEGKAGRGPASRQLAGAHEARRS